MFGWKVEGREGVSTIGGGLVRSGDGAAGMPDSYGPPAGNAPFIAADPTVVSQPLGTLTSRRIDSPGAAEALAAFSDRRAAEDRACGSRRTSHGSRDVSLDQRLERLGIIGARPLR